MPNTVLFPQITDELAAAHPALVMWSDRLGWLPRVAGGATEDDGDGGETGDDDTSGDGGEGDGETGDDGTDDGKTEQPDIDAIVQKRLGQARKQWQKEADEAAAKAKMTEAERLKAEKAEAEKAAADKTAAADARVIRSEAKVAAVAAGVKPDRAAAFLRVLDLDGIEIGDDGEPDTKAIAAAIKSTLADFPEFKGGTGGKGGASGGEHGDGPKPKPKTLAEAVGAHYS